MTELIHNSVISCSVTPSLSITSRISGSRKQVRLDGGGVRSPGQAERGWHNSEVERKTMAGRRWFILAAVALAWIGFGYQYNTISC
jgi:hypothetical protein